MRKYGLGLKFMSIGTSVCGRLVPAVVLLALTAGPATSQRQLTEQRYRDGVKRGLESVKSITDQQEHHKLRFGANLFFAHEGLIEHVPLGVLLKEVDAFRDLGINRVDINMGLFPWRDKDEKYIAKYDAVVKRIRDAGLDLAINPQYSPVRHRVSSLAEWTREAIPVYEEIARRYKPEILVTIHEPTTMNKRMKAAASPAEWRDFVRAAALAVRKASPGTRCGAGALHVEKEYFREFLSVDELDVVTIDIYGLAGLRRYNEMIRMAGRPVSPSILRKLGAPPTTRDGERRGTHWRLSAPPASACAPTRTSISTGSKPLRSTPAPGAWSPSLLSGPRPSSSMFRKVETR